MRLGLVALQLRSGVDPVAAISRSSLGVATFSVVAASGVSALNSSADGTPIIPPVAPGDALVVIFNRGGGIPPWQRFIQDALALPSFGAPSSSLGAIVFCAVGSLEQETSVSWVGWCFGSGSRALRRTASDPRFGLLAALNTLTESGDGRSAHLRSMQYRTTSPYFQQTAHRAARDIPVTGFRIDRQSDLLSAAGGRSDDPDFGDVLGSRALKFRAEIDSIADLSRLSALALARARQNRYRDEFAWVDNTTPVYDETLIANLREQVLEQLGTRPPPVTVDALIPDDLLGLDEDRAIHFVALPREQLRSASRTTLTVASVAQLVRAAAVAGDASQALSQELRFLDADRNLLGTATVEDCVCAELQLDGNQYMLYDGDYYRVDVDFVAGVNEELARARESTLDLPCYRGGGEPEYNRLAGDDRPDQLVVLDRAMIRLPGEYGVEACDLVHRSGALIHVKRRGKSAVLSHLFSQATTSCGLLGWSPEARQQLSDLVRSASPSPSVRDAVISALSPLERGSRDLEITFAFLGDWQGRTVANLPLFSRITLTQAIRRIQQLGFQPTIKLVDLCR
jgi:uncharacterized protein (TIGR04141 family)